MHSEYITTCCILNKKDKLSLLKYANTDITDISIFLKPIVLSLMDQCYNHVNSFHQLNKQRNKKYTKLEPLVEEQMKDMLFVKEKFIDFFDKPGKKTKEDLYTYILGSQISGYSFNEYLYHVLFKSIRKEFLDDFWDKYMLDAYSLQDLSSREFYILRDKEEECSTGVIDIDLQSSVDYFDKYAQSSSTYDRVERKLDIAKKCSLVLDNYYDKNFSVFNRPYEVSINELVDNIKVAISIDKPKQYIKRI